jgi:hypothetical protein
MLPSFWRDEIIRLRAPKKTDRNNTIYDWDNAVPLAIKRSLVQVATGSENNTNREATLAVYRVFLPPTADVLATDRIKLDVEETPFEIIGEPLRHKSPTGRLNHIELLLQRWKG